MRQILIKANKNIDKLSGYNFDFKIDKDMHDLDMEPGKVTMLKFPFEINVISGGQFNLSFTLNQALTSEGVMLLGAYFEGNKVTAALMNLSDGVISVENKFPILKGQLIEVVLFRQIKEELESVQIVGSKTILPTKKSRKGKKKN